MTTSRTNWKLFCDAQEIIAPGYSIYVEQFINELLWICYF